MQTYDVVRLILTTTLSDREIAAAVGVSKTTVGRYRQLARAKALVWEDIAAQGPLALQERLNRPRSGGRRKAAPDLSLFHDQLQAKGMTLQLLWEDYKRENPDTALCYSHLAAQLRRFRHTLPTVMRQHHVPGERVFVDYSGLRPHYLDAQGKRVPVELFVGVLGGQFVDVRHVHRHATGAGLPPGSRGDVRIFRRLTPSAGAGQPEIGGDDCR